MKERTLTDEERKFAEQNIRSLQKWEQTQYYDVAAIAYLHAVTEWFDNPETHRWKFSTIANNKIRSEIYKERNREMNSIYETCSLDEKISDDGEAVNGDFVTYENLQYVNYISEENDIMKVSYNVEVKKETPQNKQLSEENRLVVDFLRRKEKNMKFEYDTNEEAAKKGNTIRYFIKRKHLTTIYSKVSGNCVYVIRV